MATLRIFTLTILVALFFVPLSFSADPPGISPSPPPELGSDAASTPQNPLSPGTSPSASPSFPPSLNSPPAPPPSDSAPESSPEAAPGNAPAVPISHENEAGSGDLEGKDSSGGMKGGQKAGIAIGVIAGICIVGLGAFVYKKRQQNIQRSQFGYAARREILLT